MEIEFKEETLVMPGIAQRRGKLLRQGNLNQYDHDHVPFIISLFEDRKHRAISPRIMSTTD